MTRLACIAAICWLSTTALSQTESPASKRTIAGKVAQVAPVIDGKLDDESWKAAPTATRFTDQYQGSTAAEQTLVRILYDAKFIYIAFVCHDSQPDKIMARETVQDSKYANLSFGRSADTEDNVEVYFDPFRSHQDSDVVRLSVNAIGTRSIRVGSGRAAKREWKGEWTAAVQKTPTGWTAEMRVPWSVLNFRSSGKPADMGLNFRRFHYRTQVTSFWSNIGPSFFYDLNGVWAGVIPPSDTFKPKIALLPYVLTGISQGDAAFKTGIDARVTVKPELTAVASLNPDFATVENAVESLQFSRTERFVSERRPFFTEGSGIFGFDEFTFNIFFYPRRIQNFDAGAKIYGKIGPSDSLGVLTTFDAGSAVNTIARYRHDLSPTSNVGFIFSDRSAIGDQNTMGILHQNTRLGKLKFESFYGGSSGVGAGGTIGNFALAYNDKHNQTVFQWAEVAPHWRNANGLTLYTDLRGPTLTPSWFAEWRKGPFRSFRSETNLFYRFHKDGRPFDRGLNTDFRLTTRGDLELKTDVVMQRFDDSTDEAYSLTLTQGITNRFRRFGIQVITGRQGGSPYDFLGPLVSMRIAKKIDLSYAGALQNLRGHDQQHVASINMELSPTRSLGGRLVILDGSTNWYLSFRNAGNKGIETFVIVGDPNAAKFQSQMLVKVVAPF